MPISACVNPEESGGSCQMTIVTLDAGHSTAAAALRYQHVVSGQDEAIACYLNELVESTQRARADEQRTRDPETRTDTGGDDGTRTHDPLLAKQVL